MEKIEKPLQVVELRQLHQGDKFMIRSYPAIVWTIKEEGKDTHTVTHGQEVKTLSHDHSVIVMEINTLKHKLSFEQQGELLKVLFGFTLERLEGDEDGRWILDEEGDEFYGRNENCKWDLDTLEGIFAYTAYVNQEIGKRRVQSELRKALDI